MNNQHEIIERIFNAQNDDGYWKKIPKTHKYYPNYLHYVPNFKATLWTLILLADLKHNPKDHRLKKPLKNIKAHFYDPKYGIYTLKKDHFPIPCLNGNIIYLDSYFNRKLDKRSRSALTFFYQFQRFDDGCYIDEKNQYCTNKSCYGKHSCYWGITKLLKGISFIPKGLRTKKTNDLLARCIQFVLLHQVCFSSRKKDKIMIKHMDRLTFPNMYKSDFLEILWLLKREKVRSPKIDAALRLLIDKKQPDGHWPLERKINNMTTSIGPVNKSNSFITERALDVLSYYC